MTEQEWRKAFWLVLEARIVSASSGPRFYRLSSGLIVGKWPIRSKADAESGYIWLDPADESAANLEVLLDGLIRLVQQRQYQDFLVEVDLYTDTISLLSGSGEHNYRIDRPGLIATICALAGIPDGAATAVCERSG